MKKVIKEQTMDSKTKLKKGLEFGCISPKTKELNFNFGDYKGEKVYYGKNKQNQTIIYFADGHIENLSKPGENRYWYSKESPCEGLELSVGSQIDSSKLTPDQKSYIDTIKTSEGVVDTKPSSYETEKGKWDIIDLNSRNSKLFPEPGKYLVYKQKGEVNVTSPQQDNIINALIGKGFQKAQPDANRSEFFIKVNLQTIENGKYKEYFSQPFYMYQPIENVKIEDLLKDRQTKFDSQKVDKKQCRQTIDVLYTAYVKNYKLEDAERVSLKNYAQRCSEQKNFVFGVKNKLEKLMTLNPKDPSKLSLKLKNENNGELKSLVRESLIEVSDNKKRMLTEERNIVKTRMNLLTENVNIKSKKSREKFCDDLLNEMIYLNRQGFDRVVINEGFFDMIKGLFGNSGEAILQTFKQKIAEWLMDKFAPDGFKNTWLGGIMVNAISDTDISDIPKLTECGFLTKTLAKAISEEITKKLLVKAGADGTFYDILRNAVFESLEDSSLGQKIEGKLVEIVCPKLSGVKSKMDNLGSLMKEKALAKS